MGLVLVQPTPEGFNDFGLPWVQVKNGRKVSFPLHTHFHIIVIIAVMGRGTIGVGIIQVQKKYNNY